MNDARVFDRLRSRARTRDVVDPRTAAATAARKGRALLFSMEPCWGLDEEGDLGEWKTGGYPANFMRRAYETLGVTDPSRVLHLCAGGVRSGVTLDIRLDLRPKVVADVRALPFRDESFDWIMADPPYAESYAEQLYGTGSVYPRPGPILREAARVLRPGGRFGLLHYIAPMPHAVDRVRLVGCWGVWLGTNMAIRAWSVYEKFQPEMPWGAPRRAARSVAERRS